MNFIRETDRFAKELEAWKNGHGWSNADSLKDLSLVWHKFINIPERKAVTYPGSLGEIQLVDTSCGSCNNTKDMLQLVCNWRDSKELQAEVYVNFEGVPQAKIEIQNAIEKVDYSKKKMHEIRSIAKAMRLDYSSSTSKEDLLKLIYEKG